MAYKVNFSIPEEDKKIYNHLMNMKRNKSRYIVDLIKKDLGLTMSDTDFNNIDATKLDELIEKKVKELLNKDKEDGIEISADLNRAVSLNDDDDFE